MHPRVRDLYKRFLVVGLDYPLGLDSVRTQVKAGFRSRAHLTAEADILAAVNFGRYQVREMVALIQLKKYRSLRGRYQEDELPTVPAVEGDVASTENTPTSSTPPTA